LFDYTTVLLGLDAHVRRLLPHQTLDPASPDDGTFVLPGVGMPTADHTTGGAATLSLCYALLLDGSALRGDGELLDRAIAAIEALRRLQRPTGLIDLPKVDFDSPPDTAFMVQAACPVLELARHQAAGGDEAARRIADALQPFIASAAAGIVGRGFRTPNHRWVICSALAQAMSLLPDLDALPYVESILAEGIDINREGVYSERSAGIYDTVCNRALRKIAHHLDRPWLLDHVRANLDFCIAMLETDGSVLTAISRRQDHDMSVVPGGMVDSLFDMAIRDGRGDWARAADLIFDAVPQDKHRLWFVELFASNPAYQTLQVSRQPLHEQVDRFLPQTGLWRVRERETSFAVVSDSEGVLTVRRGRVALKRVGIRGSYFHRSVFKGETMERTDAGVRMQYRAKGHGQPGWDLPLGRAAEFDDPAAFYEIARTRRDHWPLPDLGIDLSIDRVTDGLDLHVETAGGYDRIPFVVEFLFEAQGRCRSAGFTGPVRPGQTLLLTEGEAALECDGDTIVVGPGENQHALAAMLNTKSPGTAFRVQIPLVTPVDFTATIRWR